MNLHTRMILLEKFDANILNTPIQKARPKKHVPDNRAICDSNLFEHCEVTISQSSMTVITHQSFVVCMLEYAL